MTSPSLAPDKPCPICGKPSLEKFRPFCSGRCADVDLNRWLSGGYAIPTRETDDDPDRPPMRDPDAEP
ncbi:MAG: DNA gyrase inhibitor YacG [Pseudorhodoplanes sp.]|uniref:DNA gyrase inhibitor YacG n=1 Tax=Pseudorhodoplanes sp. TaxID=1934341 RepID=UPI003D11187A